MEEFFVFIQEIIYCALFRIQAESITTEKQISSLSQLSIVQVTFASYYMFIQESCPTFTGLQNLTSGRDLEICINFKTEIK